MIKVWQETYDARPADDLCARQITVDVVGTRCVYLNNHRIAGGKPYVSENISSRSMSLTVRDALNAFSEAELLAYLFERREQNAYCAGARNYRDKLEAMEARDAE